MKTLRIASYFPLIYKTILMRKEIFNWVFNCNNMFMTLLVYLVYHPCKCSCLSRPRRACNKNKTSRFFYKLRNNRRKSQLLKVPYFKRNQTKSPCYTTSLYINISTEPAESLDTK